MKFARLLEYHTVPEWSAYYIDYRLLKNLVFVYLKSLFPSVPDITESFLGTNEVYQELSLEISAQCDKVSSFYLSKFSSLKLEIDSFLAYIYNLKRASTLNESEAKSLLSMGERDDAQNRATSMQRAFTDLHQHIIWLEQFCEFNYIAFLKILAKFKGDCFRDKIEQSAFRNWQKDLEQLKDCIYAIVADECLNGKIEEAKQILLENKHFKTEDIGVISFCVGVLAVIVVLCGQIMNNNDLAALEPAMNLFRALFLIGFAMLLFAFTVFVLEKYSVNWLYIFELTPVSKLSYIHMLSAGTSLLTLLVLFFTLHLSTTYYYPFFVFNIIPIMTLAVFLLIFFCPFRIFGKSGRYEIISLFFQLIISPFGEIRFKNYMFGSWLTSMIVPLKDLYITFVFIYEGYWVTNSKPQVSEFVLLIISILPFSWRILQNTKRVVHNTSILKRQMLNMIRYLISIGLVLSAYFDFYNNYFWTASFIIGSLTISLLDVLQDWRIDLNSSNSRCFPIEFLYFAAVSNLLLRFAGLATLMPLKVMENDFIGKDALMTCFAVLELLRGMQWSIIRIEREKRDNTENFRDIQYIPVTFNKC